MATAQMISVRTTMRLMRVPWSYSVSWPVAEEVSPLNPETVYCLSMRDGR